VAGADTVLARHGLLGTTPLGLASSMGDLFKGFFRLWQQRVYSMCLINVMAKKNASVRE
jgi:hypothetical protein